MQDRSGLKTPRRSRYGASGRAAMLLAAAFAVAALTAPVPALGADEDPAANSAIYLMRRSTSIHRDGSHNRLLKALRHLKDPSLQPFFSSLAERPEAVLRIHGILGLAEVSKTGTIDLKRIALLDDEAAQAQLVTAGLDSELLTTEQQTQLLAWPGLSPAVKSIIAAKRIETGDFTDTALLKQAMKTDSLPQQSLIGLLLTQLGDPQGTAALEALSSSTDRQRDAIRLMLLRTALKHEYDKAGPWAQSIVAEEGTGPTLQLYALRTAMRFGEPEAIARWKKQFKASTDKAERTRLAITALQLSPWLEPAIFDLLLDDTEELIRAAGAAGRAIATRSNDIADRVGPLLLLHHPIINGWALSYAKHEAKPLDAQLILLGLIMAYEQGPEVTRIRRLDTAVEAAQQLFERDPRAATQLLRPLLASKKTNDLLRKGLLLGLVRSQQPGGHAVIDGLPDFDESDAQNLALLLKVRGDVPLSERQLDDLRLLVRGGGGLQDSLRIQAGWAYLKHLGLTQQAFDQAL